jgi:hypothetical protein
MQFDEQLAADACASQADEAGDAVAISDLLEQPQNSKQQAGSDGDQGHLDLQGTQSGARGIPEQPIEAHARAPQEAAFRQCMDDLADEKEPFTEISPKTQMQWQIKVAWLLVHVLQLVPFGGFLRDIFKGCPAKDIDTAVTQGPNDEALQNKVDEIMHEAGLKQGKNEDQQWAHWRRSTNSGVNNLYYQVSERSDITIHIQLVDKNAKGLSWTPDVSINGLGYSAQVRLVLRSC